MLNIGLEHFAYNFIFKGQDIHLYGTHYIAAEVGAWLVGFAISFPAGFILSRHIVFPESNLHGRIQLFRYALTTVSFIILTYLLIKFFAWSMESVNQTIRYTAVCIITAILSYISQRKFTFKTIEEEMEEEVVAD